MKTLFTSLLLLAFTVGQATNTAIDSTEKNKSNTSSTTPANSTVSIQQLQEENARLKAQLAAVENRMDEERGTLQFNYSMHKMLSVIEKVRVNEKMLDLESKANFNSLMGNTLILLQRERNNSN
jgi:hypothetical protein